MTKLIDNCLINASLVDLYSFKFALIDAPGPIYDGFLGPDKALINLQSPQEMLLDDRNGIYNLDIMTGLKINKLLKILQILYFILFLRH